MTSVILIDDDELILEQVQGWFLREGFDVWTTSSGSEAIEHALGQPPDLIICDIAMPEMSGYEILSALRDHNQTAFTPFIFLTGQTDRSFMRHGMELGADDYLTKPFTRPELMSAVRTRLERKAASSKAHQHELDEIKTNLIRTVTHELKTPLVNIDLIRQIINRQVDHLDRAEIRELVDSMGSGTDRLSHLIEQMVYVTQLDTGVLSRETLRANPMPVSLWQLLPGGIDLGRRYAFRNKDLEITTDDRDPGAAVIGHALALKHALAELVANALNYSPEGGTVTVGAWLAEGRVWISVTDHGSGMTEQQKTQAMLPFEQVNRERHEQQGIGLGLPVVKRIVDIHDGALDIHSMEGRGTQVIMRLPAAPAG